MTVYCYDDSTNLCVLVASILFPNKMVCFVYKFEFASIGIFSGNTAEINYAKFLNIYIDVVSKSSLFNFHEIAALALMYIERPKPLLECLVVCVFAFQ